MHTIDINEARTRLPELIRDAAGGVEVVITQSDGTAVRLVPVGRLGRPRFGSARGMFTIADDFDAPLDDFAAYER